MQSIYKQADVNDFVKIINLWKNVMAKNADSLQETQTFMKMLKCV